MGIASVLSMAAHLGAFGPMAQAFSALIALVTAFVASPLIAWATKGRYYIARQHRSRSCRPAAPTRAATKAANKPPTAACSSAASASASTKARTWRLPRLPGLPICSLCCTLDARCDDLCKPEARLASQWNASLRRLLPARMWPQLDAGLSHYLLLMALIVPGLALLLAVLHAQASRVLWRAGRRTGADAARGLHRCLPAAVLI
jgi:hypothetical protein